MNHSSNEGSPRAAAAGNRARRVSARQVMTTRALLVITTFTAFSGFASLAEAQSQRSTRAEAHARRSGHRASTVSSRPARRSAPRRQVQPPSRLVAPGGLGSAANVRPGFYQQLNAPSHHRGHHGHAVPIYVYPAYYPEVFFPQTYHTPSHVYSEPAPAPEAPAAPPQIYIVTPPVVATPPVSVAPAPAPPVEPPSPQSTDPGEIRFSVLPPDARVYLDDDYLGTGAELAALDEAPLFPPGVHILEVTHPDYRPQRLVFGASDSKPAHVLIDLSIDKIGRRTRVR